MVKGGGLEYFWMCERALADYRIPENVIDDVLAHSVYLAFIMPHELSYNLIRWSVLRSIKKYCSVNKMYTLIPLSEIDNSWIIFQPELSEGKIVDLANFRKGK